MPDPGSGVLVGMEGKEPTFKVYRRAKGKLVFWARNSIGCESYDNENWGVR